MEIGIVGLGKMGANIALNFQDHGHRVVGYDMSPEAASKAREQGIEVADDLAGLVGGMTGRKVVWLMVPCGEATDKSVEAALELLGPGDILIDGGNSFYKDSKRHAGLAAQKGVLFLDAGTSGGMSGARNGACLMVGGDREAFEYVEDALRQVSVEEGCVYTGPAGSGHFMKMVHNGIEYGMMQAIGEGMSVLEHSEYDYDLEAVAHNWNHGSVIRGWLMELAEQQLAAHPGLDDIKGVVAANGEAKWTVETALDLEVPVPVIALSLMVRNASQEDDSFACKMVAALRNGFGGHAVVSKDGE